MMNGIGGDLFAMVYEAKTGKLFGLNAGGWAATGVSAEGLAAKGITRMPQRGVYSVTVPGAIAGWDALRSRFGTMGFDQLLAPAIAYARNGYPLVERICATIDAGGNRNSHPCARKASASNAWSTQSRIFIRGSYNCAR